MLALSKSSAARPARAIRQLSSDSLYVIPSCKWMGQNENVNSFITQTSLQELWLLTYTEKSSFATENIGFAIQLSTS